MELEPQEQKKIVDQLLAPLPQSLVDFVIQFLAQLFGMKAMDL